MIRHATENLSRSVTKLDMLRQDSSEVKTTIDELKQELTSLKNLIEEKQAKKSTRK
jgi:chromosome segregation ATPase